MIQVLLFKKLSMKKASGSTDNISFINSWRWFGPDDPISLDMIQHTDADAIVTALHHIPNGTIWSVEEIQKRKQLLAKHGFSWSVAESLPISEEIKYQGPNYLNIIENYKQSLVNLGKCGITLVCYNFMPVIDWIRTDLSYQWKDLGKSMLFDYPTFVAFDVFILKRPKAEEAYSDSLLTVAERVFRAMSEKEKESLAHNIIVVTQGFIDGGVGDSVDYKKAFLDKLELYKDIDTTALRDNLSHFLNEILPVAEEQGIKMCLHPDDPPFPVLGLPRIAGTEAYFKWIMEQNKSVANGITFCSGSLSSRPDNNLVDFLARHADMVHFAHLRNTTILNKDGSFCESGHLEGGVDMAKIIALLHNEMQRRKDSGIENHQIPMRPDHGLKMKEDRDIASNPGYPYYGRIKGLKEIGHIEKDLKTG